MGHRIVPLHLGDLAEIDRARFVHGSAEGTCLSPPCIAWVVEAREELLLVDAGPGSPQRAARHHPPLVQDEAQTLTAALAAAGYTVADITAVLVSHLHWDHIGGLPEVPDVPVVVQGAELRAAVLPVASQRAQYEIGQRGLRPVWTDALDRIEAVEGRCRIREGVDLVPLPGHTPGSQGVLVATAAGGHLIAGDAIPLADNWARRIPNGIHSDLGAYDETFATIAALDAEVLPGHDPAVLGRDAYP
jgi:N-acyl homoserine lactone hydrolase